MLQWVARRRNEEKTKCLRFVLFLGDSSVKRVYGIPLHEHLRVTNKRIALPLEICITLLMRHGLHEEGLFRIAGGSSRVKRLRSSIDSGCFSQKLIPEYQDVHVLASALKMYLRELPDPPPHLPTVQRLDAVDAAARIGESGGGEAADCQPAA
jgi:hypothetical protein